MKNLLLSLAFFLSFFTVSYAQSAKNDWRDMVYGTWKLDSFHFDSKYMAEIMKERNKDIFSITARFNKDGRYLFYLDSTVALTDSFHLMTDGKIRIIYLGLFSVKISSMTNDRLIVDVNNSGFGGKLGMGISGYFRRADGIPHIQSLAGTWKKSKYSWDYDYKDHTGEKEENAEPVFVLNRNGQAKVSLKGLKDSGTWKTDEANLSLNLHLSKGDYTCHIHMLEKKSMMISNPLYQDSMLNLERKYDENSDYWNMHGADSTAIATTMRDSMSMKMKQDSITAVRSIFKTWDAEKRINGKDTSAPGKNIFLKLREDNSCTLTVNGETLNGTIEGNYWNGILTFSREDKESLAFYEVIENYETSERTLKFSMVLPGDKKTSTFIMKAK